jgi:GNAT superfamily N-acetyltransferase
MIGHGFQRMIAITGATVDDAEEILRLQKLAYKSEAELYGECALPPLTQSIESLREEFGGSVVLKAMSGERIVGSVRAKATDGVCAIGRLVVHPEFQGQGIGSQLLKKIEACFTGLSKYELFTGSKSEANIRLYERHGYVSTRTQALSPTVSITFLEKPMSIHKGRPMAGAQ